MTSWGRRGRSLVWTKTLVLFSCTGYTLFLVISNGAPYHELLMTVLNMKLCVLSRPEKAPVERAPEGLNLAYLNYSSEHGEFKNEPTKKQMRPFSEHSNGCKSFYGLIQIGQQLQWLQEMHLLLLECCLCEDDWWGVSVKYGRALECHTFNRDFFNPFHLGYTTDISSITVTHGPTTLT